MSPWLYALVGASILVVGCGRFLDPNNAANEAGGLSSANSQASNPFDGEITIAEATCLKSKSAKEAGVSCGDLSRPVDGACLLPQGSTLAVEGLLFEYGAAEKAREVYAWARSVRLLGLSEGGSNEANDDQPKGKGSSDEASLTQAGMDVCTDAFIREHRRNDADSFYVWGSKIEWPNLASLPIEVPQCCSIETVGRFASPYGQRWGRLHAGLDISQNAGSRIGSAGIGRVVFASNLGGSAGNTILVEHPGEIYTRYLHAASITVRSGSVELSQQIGIVGNTGTEAPHLHWEVRGQGSSSDVSKMRQPVNPFAEGYLIGGTDKLSNWGVESGIFILTRDFGVSIIRGVVRHIDEKVAFVRAVLRSFPNKVAELRQAISDFEIPGVDFLFGSNPSSSGQVASIDLEQLEEAEESLGEDQDTSGFALHGGEP